MRTRLGQLAALCCAVAVFPSPAQAIRLTPIALSVHPTDLPGYAGAKVARHVERSVRRFGEESGQPVAALERFRFSFAVTELFGGEDGVVASNAAVFGSRRGARWLLGRELARLTTPRRHVRFAVHAIPGASAIEEILKPGEKGEVREVFAAGVMFSTGRCFALVDMGGAPPGEAPAPLPGGPPGAPAGTLEATIRSDVTRAALALYRRGRHACALPRASAG